MATPSLIHSPATDPHLRDWLRWASENHDVPVFVRSVAETALSADSPRYALSRPLLLELKRQYPRFAA
jgi:hypothetical protein